jgi:hypothetical protein
VAVIANMEMSQDELTDNILSSVEQISESVPGQWKNIKQIHIKTALSTSIPIYLSAGDPKEVSLPKKRKAQDKVEAEEISTLFGAKVKVYPNGEIKVIKDGEKEEEPRKRKRPQFNKKKSVQKKKQSVQKIKTVKASKGRGVKRLRNLGKRQNQGRYPFFGNQGRLKQ